MRQCLNLSRFHLGWQILVLTSLIVRFRYVFSHRQRSKGINEMRGEEFGALMITHYQRLLNYITPDKVHAMFLVSSFKINDC
jgi:hypothetical protein